MNSPYSLEPVVALGVVKGREEKKLCSRISDKGTGRAGRRWGSGLDS